MMGFSDKQREPSVDGDLLPAIAEASDSGVDRAPPTQDEASLDDPGVQRSNSQPNVPRLPLHKVTATAPNSRMGLHSRGSATARPFTTSSNWPGNQKVVQTARKPSSNSPSLSEFSRGFPFASERSAAVPDISQVIIGARAATPQALYTNQFFGTPRNRGLKASASIDTSNTFVNLAHAPSVPEEQSMLQGSREWLRMVFRMPTCAASNAEFLILGEAVKHILGPGSTLHVQMQTGEPTSFVEVLLIEKPTSRKQAQLLAEWYQVQLRILSNAVPPTAEELRRIGLATPRRTSSPPLATDPALSDEPQAPAWQAVAENEVARRMVLLWGEAGMPGHVFFHNSGHKISVEGLVLPNDSRYLRAVLQISGIAAATAIHQVAMHCHERGRLLIQIWNAYSGIMDMELSQARFQVRVLLNEKQKLLAQLYDAGLRLSTSQGKDEALAKMASKLKRLQGDLAIKDAELEKAQTEIADLKYLLLQWNGSGLHPEEIEEMEAELYEAKMEREEAERTRDVALTALFTGVEKSQEIRRSIAEIKKATEGRLPPSDAKDIEMVFGKLEMDVMKIAAMEAMVESKMDVARGRMQPSAQANFMQIMKAKTAAKKLTGFTSKLLLKKAADAENADRGISFRRSSTLIPPDHHMDIAGVLDAANVTVIPKVMLDADMADVDAMSQDDMWAEIQRLRERENTLLYAVQMIVDDKESMEAYLQSLGETDAQGNPGGRGAGRSGGDGNEGQPRAPPKKGQKKKAGKRSVSIVATSKGAEGSKDADPRPGEARPVSTALLDMVSAGFQLQGGAGGGFGPSGSDDDGGGAQGDGTGTGGKTTGRTKRAISLRQQGFSDRRKDSIILMLRALVSGREEDAKQKKERVMKHNKVSSQSAAKLNTSKLMELEEQLNESREAARELHHEYSRVWNVLVASGVDVGSLVPANHLAPSEDVTPPSRHQDKGNETGKKGTGNKKKIGAAEKARRAMAAERTTLKLGAQVNSGKKTQQAEHGDASKGSEDPKQDSESSGNATKDKAGEAVADDHDQVKKASETGVAQKLAGAAPKRTSSAAMLLNISKQMVNQAKQNAFSCKDTALREAMFKFKNVKPRAREWLLKLIDQVYKGKANQDAKLVRDGEELVAMPAYLFAHLQAQYGAKSLVQEYASCVVSTVRLYSSEDVRCETFAKFLSQEWDTPVLRVFLDATERISTYGALVHPCCEYPDTYFPGRGMPPWLCTWKAMAVADILLGKRSKKCTQGFYDILDKNGCPVEPSEKAKFFWSPKLPANASDSDREGGEMTFMKLVAAAAAEEHSRGTALTKLSSAVFLACLCKEYARLESVLEDAVPVLFKEHDVDFSGYLDRKEIFIMLRALHGSNFDEDEAGKVWEMAENSERIQAQEQGYEPPVGEVGVVAFHDAVKRTDAVRRYMRLERTPPPPPELGAEHRESQSKMLYMVVERHWRAFEESVNRILDSGDLESSESNVRGQITKMTAEKDGARRSQMFVNILKTLCDFMLVKIQRQCNPTILSSMFDPMMEANLERVEKSVKVLFGWKTLLEDDSKTNAALHNPNAGLVARKKAVKDWVDQSRAFLEYKVNLQKQAAAILERKFYKRWRRHQGKDGMPEDAEDAVPVTHLLQFLKMKDER